MKRIAIVAGELSGDLLGADLMRALKVRYPGVRFEGIGGPAMLREGLMGLYPLETLSVMGLFEVVRHLPRLLAVRRQLVRHLRAQPPDLFVGIDAPDFNLGLERRLRESGIKTAHYVSPSVWAWRQGRIKGIARSVDLMLTLFPFEARFYEDHGVPVTFVGHPAADRFPMEPDVSGCREALGIAGAAPVVAVLPGSRSGEVARLAPLFAAAVAKISAARPEARFVVPVAHEGLRVAVEEAFRRAGVEAMLVAGNADTVMGAADVVLTASGTATLEAMLLKRPMVVGYRVAAGTAWLVKHFNLVRIPFFSLPNLLARREVVPEYIQDRATADAIAGGVLAILEDPGRAEALQDLFREQHELLRRGAGDRSAEALAALVGS